MNSITVSGLKPVSDIRSQLRTGEFDSRLALLYGVSGKALAPYRERISAALDAFVKRFGEQDVCVFSVSGRTELGGNHTDHQHGRVLAAGVSLDILAVAAPSADQTACVLSEGYPEDNISLHDLEIHAEEAGTSAALIRGTAARFSALGQPVGGFCAYMTSSVLKGSGLSSSAAFEVMIGTILNDFYAGNVFSLTELAQIAQYAENSYFMKPCGLMDQMACALGTVCAMDFADPSAPVTETVSMNLSAAGYALCIIDSGADHADLTDEYAAVPREMCAAAKALGRNVLRETDEAAFWAALPVLRQTCGDRAVLRAMHFYGDNARVPQQIAALKAGNFDAYFRLVLESGRSSAFALQNVSAAGHTKDQAVAVALALCEHLLGEQGAYRVHGGGFAGTVQAYVPAAQITLFQQSVEAVLGKGTCHIVQFRGCGACSLWGELPEGGTSCS